MLDRDYSEPDGGKRQRVPGVGAGARRQWGTGENLGEKGMDLGMRVEKI